MNDTEKKSLRAEMLDEANSLVNGDRNNQYGPPHQDFQRTADALTAFGFRLGDEPLGAHHVAMILATVKLSRLVWTPGKRDSWVDLAGYAACGFEAHELTKTPELNYPEDTLHYDEDTISVFSGLSPEPIRTYAPPPRQLREWEQVDSGKVIDRLFEVADGRFFFGEDRAHAEAWARDLGPGVNLYKTLAGFRDAYGYDGRYEFIEVTGHNGDEALTPFGLPPLDTPWAPGNTVEYDDYGYQFTAKLVGPPNAGSRCWLAVVEQSLGVHDSAGAILPGSDVSVVEGHSRKVAE